MQKLFAVYDIKAASYGALICCPTRGIALRSFADACAAPDSPMALYPGDFSLHELGEYDPNSGKLVGHPTPVHVASAASVIDQLRIARAPKSAVEAVAAAVEAGEVSE